MLVLYDLLLDSFIFLGTETEAMDVGFILLLLSLHILPHLLLVVLGLAHGGDRLVVAAEATAWVLLFADVHV